MVGTSKGRPGENDRGTHASGCAPSARSYRSCFPRASCVWDVSQSPQLLFPSPSLLLSIFETEILTGKLAFAVTQYANGGSGIWSHACGCHHLSPFQTGTPVWTSPGPSRAEWVVEGEAQAHSEVGEVLWEGALTEGACQDQGWGFLHGLSVRFVESEDDGLLWATNGQGDSGWPGPLLLCLHHLLWHVMSCGLGLLGHIQGERGGSRKGRACRGSAGHGGSRVSLSASVAASVASWPMMTEDTPAVRRVQAGVERAGGHLCSGVSQPAEAGSPLHTGCWARSLLSCSLKPSPGSCGLLPRAPALTVVRGVRRGGAMSGGEASKVWFCSVFCAALKVSCKPSSSPRTLGKAWGILAQEVGVVRVPRHLAGPRSVGVAAEKAWVGGSQAS